jgi:hypothetical protein
MKFIITNGSSEYKTGLQHIDNDKAILDVDRISDYLLMIYYGSHGFYGTKEFRSFRLCLLHDKSDSSDILTVNKDLLPLTCRSLISRNEKNSIRVILSDEYSLKDLTTILKFNIKKTEYVASIVGNLDVLQCLKNNDCIQNINLILAGASEYGHIHILNWVKQSLAEISYDNTPINLAIVNNHISVLEWWIKSGLPLKYDKNIVKHVYNHTMGSHPIMPVLCIPVSITNSSYIEPATVRWLKNNIPNTCEDVGCKVRKFYRSVFTDQKTSQKYTEISQKN